MGLAVEGEETEVFDFIAILEVTKKAVASRVNKEEEVGEVPERITHHGREH